VLVVDLSTIATRQEDAFLRAARALPTDQRREVARLISDDVEGAAAPSPGDLASVAHAVVMSDPTKYTVPLDDLVDSVRVPLDEQVEEQDAERPEHDESAGHLPGNVRPYGA
jgi:hypothetical protein